jgi:hypothetical protein
MLERDDMSESLKNKQRRHSTHSRWEGTMTTERTISKERRHRTGRRAASTITTESATKRRHSATRPALGMITTVCVCGLSFQPTSSHQKHHSAQCRKLAYEKSEKAKARSSKYWKSDKGNATYWRYHGTGAVARNNRAYRQRLSTYEDRFSALCDKHEYENLTVKLVFGNGDQQIPEKAAYRMFRSWASKYRWYSRYKWKPRPDNLLYTELLEYLFGVTAEQKPIESEVA